jgi:hypothetical protein
MITIEDNSPIISYSAGWRAGHSLDDKLANLWIIFSIVFVNTQDLLPTSSPPWYRYSQSSFTATTVDGASAIFTFNGTDVEIFGARRENHGSYHVKLDNTSYPPFSGNASPATFQQPLFTASNLNQGAHTVTLTNQGNTFLDIDFVRAATHSMDFLLLTQVLIAIIDNLADNHRRGREWQTLCQ